MVQRQITEAVDAAVDVAVGVMGGLVGVVQYAARPVLHVIEPPVVALLRPPMQALSDRGRRNREAVAGAVGRAADAAIPAVMGAVMSHVDVNELMQDNVDINQIAAGIDVNAIVERVDLVGLAEFVMNEV